MEKNYEKQLERLIKHLNHKSRKKIDYRRLSGQKIKRLIKLLGGNNSNEDICNRIQKLVKS